MSARRNPTGVRAMGIFLAVGIALCSLPSPSPAQDNQPTSSPPTGLKSESTALAVSLLGAALPIGLMLLAGAAGENAGFLPWIAVSSIAVGPSLGYFYAGLPVRGCVGIGIRAIGLAGFIGGLAMAWDDSDNSAASMLCITGAGLVLASYIGDIVSVKSAVRRHNLKVQAAQLTIVPILAPQSKTLGLQVQFSF